VVVEKQDGGEEGSRAHLMYLCEFSAEFYVLNLCLQSFLLAFERAIKYKKRCGGCKIKLILTQKPGLEPKPGQAEPKPAIWARLAIVQSRSRYKPGPRPGFQAEPELAHHYSQTAMT